MGGCNKNGASKTQGRVNSSRDDVTKPGSSHEPIFACLASRRPNYVYVPLGPDRVTVRGPETYAQTFVFGWPGRIAGEALRSLPHLIHPGPP